MIDLNLPLPAVLILGTLISLGVFELSVLLYKKVKTPLLNPLLVTLVGIIVALSLLRIPVDSFEASVQLFSFMLGPATVALAYSVYRQRRILKEHFIPIVAGCLVGSIVSMVSAYTLCRLLGLGNDLALSFIPKSVTGARRHHVDHRGSRHHHGHSGRHLLAYHGEGIPRA